MLWYGTASIRIEIVMLMERNVKYTMITICRLRYIVMHMS